MSMVVMKARFLVVLHLEVAKINEGRGGRACDGRDVEWEGPDAKKFKGTELQKIEASVKKVVKEITNMANTLDRNIKRQEQVSSH